MYREELGQPWRLAWTWRVGRSAQRTNRRGHGWKRDPLWDRNMEPLDHRNDSVLRVGVILRADAMKSGKPLSDAGIF